MKQRPRLNPCRTPPCSGIGAPYGLGGGWCVGGGCHCPDAFLSRLPGPQPLLPVSWRRQVLAHLCASCYLASLCARTDCLGIWVGAHSRPPVCGELLGAELCLHTVGPRGVSEQGRGRGTIHHPPLGEALAHLPRLREDPPSTQGSRDTPAGFRA